jgi:hypothetical protein
MNGIGAQNCAHPPDPKGQHLTDKICVVRDEFGRYATPSAVSL